MNEITLQIDDGTGTAYDRLLHGTDACPALRDMADLTIATKNGAMQSGRAAAILAFRVETNGQLRLAQTVVPMRQLILALRLLYVRYDEDGMPRGPERDASQTAKEGESNG